VRRLSVLVVSASILASLTACSGGAGNCEPTVASGNSSTAVEATGDFGSAPDVSFPNPLIAKKPERSVLITGKGDPVRDGQPLILEATILNGADGSVLQQTAYSEDGGTLYTAGDQAIPALGDALVCASVGSRVAVVTSGEDAGSTGDGPDALVFVVDVLDSFPARASGTDQLQQNGMPSVVSAPDGRPGITVPHESAPTKAKVETLTVGDGSKIKDDSRIVAKYTTVNWGTATVSDSTWEAGGASLLDLGGDQVAEGLKKALVGKTVGSRVIAVLPGEASGADASADIWVVDILGTVG